MGSTTTTKPGTLRVAMLWLIPTLMVCTGFASLGLWQLDRAQQKRDILAAYTGAPVQSLASLTDSTEVYTRMRGSAELLPYQLLLDNQVHEGRAGVHVLAPILVNENRLLLVNRGWLPLPADRSSLPAVSVPAGTIEISGQLAPLPRPGLQVGSQPALDQGQWPQLVTYIAPQQLQQDYRERLNRPELQLLEFVLQLNADNPHGFAARNWSPVNFGPDKHMGYALTWFTMVAAVLATYLILIIRYSRSTGPDPNAARHRHDGNA